jgi:F-type H+-transporting ATPase subunit delta
VLKSIFEGKIEDLSLRFFHLASKKGRAELLIAMGEEFLNQYNIYKNISKATLSTVMAMDSNLKNEFIKILEDGFGKKVELKEVTDPDLIGGFVLKISDRQIDESIKRRLNQLKLNLIDQSYKALV